MTAFELLRRLAKDECGQDLLEYGLLASVFAVGMIVIFPQLMTKATTAFGNWGTSVINSAWIPNAPVP